MIVENPEVGKAYIYTTPDMNATVIQWVEEDEDGNLVLNTSLHRKRVHFCTDGKVETDKRLKEILDDCGYWDDRY